MRSPGHKYNRAAWAAARRRERALADKAALLERVRKVCNTPEMDALVLSIGVVNPEMRLLRLFGAP